MKKICTLIFFTVLFSPSLFTQQLTLDEVLTKHFEAIGQEKLSSVSTVTLTGKQSMSGMELTYQLRQKRPDKLRIESVYQGKRIIQAVNGDTGWQTNPVTTGSNYPKVLNEEEIKTLKKQTDIDGQLFNWKEKGYLAELTGTEELETGEAYIINLKLNTEKNAESVDEMTFFISTVSFMIVKVAAKQKMRGRIFTIETYMSDFREYEEIMFPQRVESKMNGYAYSTITVDSVTFDEEIDDSVFMHPGRK